MTEEVSCPTVTAATLCQSQSILSVYSFSDKNTESAKVILIYQAKIVKKDLNHTLAGIDYVPVSSNILTQEVNNFVKESNVIFLYIKEVEEDKSEPWYFIFDGVEAKPGIEQEEDTIDLHCENYYIDTCCE